MFNQFATTVLDILFPPFCRGCAVHGSWLCSVCAGQLQPRRVKLPGGSLEQLCILGTYDHPILQRSIRDLKYAGGYGIADALGTQLARVFSAEITGAILVPVPLHKHRKRERGFNQAEELAKAIAAAIPLTEVRSVVRRIRNTTPQVLLNEEERRRNVRQAFTVNASQGEIPSRGIIVDDVYTTGATIHEVAAVLRQAGMTSVSAMAVAKG